jgi:hypothetical protein
MKVILIEYSFLMEYSLAEDMFLVCVCCLEIIIFSVWEFCFENRRILFSVRCRSSSSNVISFLYMRIKLDILPPSLLIAFTFCLTRRSFNIVFITNTSAASVPILLIPFT